MVTPKLYRVEACVFDAYGTLFDVISPVLKAAAHVGPVAQELARLWRQKQLEYTWLRSLMRVHADFHRVTQDALDYSLRVLALEKKEGLRGNLMQLYMDIEPYSDARPCLEELLKKDIRTAILSNGTPQMLHRAVNSAGFDQYFDEIVSVEEVGVFKPDPRVYARVLDRMGIADASRVVFVSANPWDAQAAAHFGFRVVRIDRASLSDDNIPGRPTLTVNSLIDLPDAIGP